MTDKRAEKAAKLHLLEETFGAQLPQRLVAARQAWTHLMAHPDDEASHRELHRLIHSLAGSAGTFGYRQVGEAARILEDILLQATDPATRDEARERKIERALTDIERMAANGTDRADNSSTRVPAYAPTTAPDKKLVYILEDDLLLAKEIITQLEIFGYRAQAFTHSAAMLQAQENHSADLFLLDINLPEGAFEGPRVAPLLQLFSAKSIPAVFISAHENWQTRLAVVRARGSAYFTKPLDFTALIERLDQLAGRKNDEPFRVVIVDDSTLLAEHYAAILQDAGMETVVVNNPEQLLEVISITGPDLVLLDLHMPQCTGVEAAQIIRQIPTYSGLPIVFLSTESALQQQLNALKVGGDDFLKKPIADTHLIDAVQIRVERFRALKKLMTCDSLTGLLNHINLKLTLERELAQAQRRGGYLSYAMIDIDHFKAVNDRHGHPMGDRVIKSLARLITQRLRKTDIAARYGGEEFAVILPDTDPDKARAVLDDMRECFADIVFTHDSGEFRLSFSVGIASTPPRSNVADLIAAADRALYAAKRGGRNCVVLASSSETPGETS